MNEDISNVVNNSIIKITPQGFCKGVVNAIRIVNNALDDETTPRPIYMLGAIVHNKHIVESFREKGVIILEGATRLRMLDGINSGTVIFTAHGVSDEVERRARSKGLNVINAVCKDVTITHDLIKEKLKGGYKILYLGRKNHPETEGVIGISDKITVIYDDTKINALPKYEGRIVLTNQTTLSYLDVVRKYEKLLQTYPQLELVEEICSATRRRQGAVIDAKGKLDLLIVVGDRGSNNTKMLKEVAVNNANLTSIMIENISSLKDIELSQYKRIGVTAGASTPTAIVDEIIDALRQNNTNYVSKLNGDDYLKR